MNIAQHCGLATLMFFGMMIFVVAGNIIGALAWRERVDPAGKWRWLFNSSYLFRGSNFRNPRHPARIAALVLLGCGAALLLILAASVIQALGAGASNVCGLAF